MWRDITHMRTFLIVLGIIESSFLVQRNSDVITNFYVPRPHQYSSRHDTNDVLLLHSMVWEAVFCLVRAAQHKWWLVTMRAYAGMWILYINIWHWFLLTSSTCQWHCPHMLEDGNHHTGAQAFCFLLFFCAWMSPCCTHAEWKKCFRKSTLSHLIGGPPPTPNSYQFAQCPDTSPKYAMPAGFHSFR